MARPQTNELAMRDFGKALAKLHRKTPAKAKDIELWAYATHGVRLSSVTIQKALSGHMDPTACAMEVLTVLAAFYKVQPEALGRFAADRLAGELSLIGSIVGPDDGRGQESAPSGWLRRTAPERPSLALVAAAR